MTASVSAGQKLKGCFYLDNGVSIRQVVYWMLLLESLGRGVPDGAGDGGHCSSVAGFCGAVGPGEKKERWSETNMSAEYSALQPGNMCQSTIRYNMRIRRGSELNGTCTAFLRVGGAGRTMNDCAGSRVRCFWGSRAKVTFQ